MVAKHVGYPNGDPRNAAGTARIGGKAWKLRAQAAPWFEELAAAFQSRFGYTLPVLETHRSLAEQRRLYDGWVKRLDGFNLAAVPGTSNHGWGLAIDLGYPLNLSTSAESKWLRENMGKYGFWDGGQASWTYREPWHIEFDGRNTGGKAPAKPSLAPGQYRETAWPFGEYALARGDTPKSVSEKFRTRPIRFRSLNGVVPAGFRSFKPGQIVRVPLDNLPIAVVVDGIPGPATWGRWQQEMGAPVTRVGGRDFIRRVQRHMNRKRKRKVKVDGLLGPETIRAIQEWVNAPYKDGKLDVPGATWRKIQQQLRDGTHSWGA